MASRSWNRVELIGNLTRDPELRYTPSGSAVCTFGLATNRYYTTADGEKKEEADFHRLVAWNKLAEICKQFLKKGTKVFVSGRLQYREWETADGQKRRDAEITIDDMIMLSPKAAEATAAEELQGLPRFAPAGAKVAVEADQRVSPEPKAAVGKESKIEEKKTEALPESKSEQSTVLENIPQEEVKDDLPF